jgi:hypothetical protein
MKQNGLQVGEYIRGVFIYTSILTRPSPLVTFICSTCGYFEHYVNDPGKLAEVAKTWVKINPKPHSP